MLLLDVLQVTIKKMEAPQQFCVYIGFFCKKSTYRNQLKKIRKEPDKHYVAFGNTHRKTRRILDRKWGESTENTVVRPLLRKYRT